MFDRPLGMSLTGSVLQLTGCVDEYSVAALRERLAELRGARDRLVVDLSDVDFLPSAGIGVLVRASVAFRKDGGDLTLVAAVGTTAHSTLSVAGLPFVTESGQPDPVGQVERVDLTPGERPAPA